MGSRGRLGLVFAFVSVVTIKILVNCPLHRGSRMHGVAPLVRVIIYLLLFLLNLSVNLGELVVSGLNCFYNRTTIVSSLDVLNDVVTSLTMCRVFFGKGKTDNRG